ncbi:peroxiredoxin-like family protein [Zhongshania sp.]|jgi:peroxiredoxin|uniref:peroxiredoxin-like family protein n=1 Tax=Zhongshania sp. TaxID=1971902 RepID=UPI002A7EE793|nr:peroxiredoxin-like family protein [Zhongshania sp.]
MKVISLLPRQEVPSLDIPLVAGKRFVLGAAPAEHFTMLLFYRGLHCPICAKYLAEFEALSSDFASRGVEIIAISTDTEERGIKMVEKTNASGVKVAYGLSLQEARHWGLYISESLGTNPKIGVEEPKFFSEPALYLIKRDGTLYYAAVQTMPFARPSAPDLLAAIDYAIKNDYPARGEYLGSV